MQKYLVAKESKNLVVYTADLSFSTIRIIVDINQMVADCRWLVVVHKPNKPLSVLLKNQWKNLRYHGLRWIPYQLVDVVQRISSSKFARSSRVGPGARYSLDSLTAMPNLAIDYVADINANSSVKKIADFEPELGLSIAAPILKEAVFGVPRLGTLNLHKGKLPDYRGMPPAFWELWNDEPEVGCSIHKVVRSLDAGDVLACTTLPVNKYSTLRGLQIELDAKGIQLMSDTVKNVLEDKTRPMPQRRGGRLYRKPTLKQQNQLSIRLKNSRPIGAKTYAALKDIYFWFRIHLNRNFTARFSSKRYPVLLYHRVSDDVRDNLTVGIEQFDRQMEILTRFYDPVSLDDLLDNSLQLSESTRPVCVTFDDGYLDNYTNAVPILIKHNIPAAFFVSSGIVGTDQRFPHDQQRSEKQIPNMCWDNVLEMHHRGFYIGSHTVTHIDCVAEDEEIVKRELEESFAEIRFRFNKNECVLAYPYGGKHNMSDDRLELVKNSGYRACLSAYGGVNRAPVNKFNIMRGGIDSEFSELAFRYRCEGLK